MRRVAKHLSLFAATFLVLGNVACDCAFADSESGEPNEAHGAHHVASHHAGVQHNSHQHHQSSGEQHEHSPQDCPDCSGASCHEALMSCAQDVRPDIKQALSTSTPYAASRKSEPHCADRDDGEETAKYLAFGATPLRAPELVAQGLASLGPRRRSALPPAASSVTRKDQLTE